MKKIFGIAIFATLITTVTLGYSIVPQVYGQTSSKSSTGCIHGTTLGLICVPNLGTHHLHTGKWFAEVNGIGAILDISSVDKDGKINGVLAGGNSTCAIGGKPCEIHGTFDRHTGRISFLATSTYRPQPGAGIFVSPVQNYTGIESEQIMPDNSHYQIHGTGKIIRPYMGPEFGWSARMFCGFAGCIGIDG